MKRHILAAGLITAATFTSQAANASIPTAMFLRMETKHALSYTSGMLTALNQSDYFSQCVATYDPLSFKADLTAYINRTIQTNADAGGQPINRTLQFFLAEHC